MNRIPAPLFAVFMVLALVLVALIAFFMGWQGGYDSRDPVEQPEYTKMIDAHKEEVRNLNSKISDLQSIVIDNQKRIDELKPYKDEYDSKKAELDKRQSDLDSRSSDCQIRVEGMVIGHVVTADEPFVLGIGLAPCGTGYMGDAGQLHRSVVFHV